MYLALTQISPSPERQQRMSKAQESTCGGFNENV